MLHRSLSSAIQFALIVFTLFLCAPAFVAQGQTPGSAPTGRATSGTTAGAITPPSPRAMLGFQPGDNRTIADWRQIADYFAKLDAASNKVKVETLGQTTLGRPFIVAFISSEENIRDLSRYKEIQRRLADPRTIRSRAEEDRLVRDGRAVVAISCSIHSTEIVASQMSMQLAYDLATADDAHTREILRDTILMLIPSANPDGVQIVADWYRKTLGTPAEGTEPPELYHHYAGHDNNRDWYMMNLPETKMVTKLFWREWFPQIVYDVHQQGSYGARFFIPPFHDPANPHIAPSLLREVGAIGSRIAANLQADGREGVITNSSYDMWWHGGFRTAPYYHNSIGILSEAASARLMTPITVTKDQLAKSSSRGMASALTPAINFPEPWQGGGWRPRDIMEMERTAVATVLSEASARREHYLKNFVRLGREAVARKQNDALGYLIPAGQGRDEAVAKLLALLMEQGVEVHRMINELHMTHAGHDGSEAMETPGGSYVVLLDQPYKSNIRALFEVQNYPNRPGANGETERPYDVTGWTLPMQMNVQTELVTGITEPNYRSSLSLVKNENEIRRDLGLPLTSQPPNASHITLTSPITNPITRPVRIGIYRSWVPSMDEGWTRFVFDSHNIPYTTLRDSDMRGGDLRARFDAVILPSQRMKSIIEGHTSKEYPAEYAGGMTKAGIENLRRFVEGGGTLICFDQSTELAIKSFDLPVRNALEGIKASQFYCPGSVLRLEVELNHPIARGLEESTDAYFINSSAFEVKESANGRARVVARYAKDDTLRSGYLLGKELIANRAALVEVSLGEGRIVLFGFRPQHRAQTWGTYPLIFNALKAK